MTCHGLCGYYRLSSPDATRVWCRCSSIILLCEAYTILSRVFHKR
jgi:hypothetical protein